MKSYTRIILITLFTITTFISIISSHNTLMIAHAGGGIIEEDARYLNSLEGVTEHYNNGTRVFEFDFMFTSDFEIIAMHNFETELYGEGWSFDNRISLTEFEGLQVKGLYTPLTFNDILNLMVKYPDMILIIDTKETGDNLFLLYDQLNAQMFNKDLDLINRVIPQLYDEDMYKYLEEKFNYSEYILTLYKLDLSNSEVIELLQTYNKIKYITISQNRDDRFSLIWNLQFRGIDVDIYIHTINSEIKAFFYEAIGAEGIYSDSIYQE